MGSCMRFDQAKDCSCNPLASGLARHKDSLYFRRLGVEWPVRTHSHGFFARESHKVDAAGRRGLVGGARCLWVVELWIELAGLKSRFSKQRKRFDTKWVDFLDDEVHGGCSARPNVRVKPPAEAGSVSLG